MARPLFAVDPGPTVLRWGWFLWLTWAVVGTGLLGEDRGSGGFALGLVLSAPFWALWLLWPLYRAWAVLSRRGQRSRGQEWQGNYYEFDGRPVRVRVDHDQFWFAADDVFDALGLDGPQRDAELGRIMAGRDGLSEPAGFGQLAFSESGLAAWLERRADADALKFRRWAQQQVIEPVRRGRASGDP
ncbi:MAG TPA: hypothetical protein VFN64_04215 [Burkholderiaceae bacterium]|nr:hypothetical protein [Burkholderiaceae bacterium]